MTKDKFDVIGLVTTTTKPDLKEEVPPSGPTGPGSIVIGTGSSLADMYDRFSKLIYLVDDSGSMTDGMKSEDKVNQFVWSDAILKQFKETIAEANEASLAAADEEGLLPEDASLYEIDGLDDQQLKEYIVNNNLQGTLGIELKKNPRGQFSSRSKIEAVKQEARNFVAARYKKYPDASVLLVSFDGDPHLLSAGATEADVNQGIDKLTAQGGDTNIYKAVEFAVNECKARPSMVHANHIVLVSDGMDNRALHIKTLLPKMQELGIVFDFIYMQGATDGDYAGHVISILKDVCATTGGEFVTVKTEQDFRQKFLAASTRLCLPPAKLV